MQIIQKTTPNQNKGRNGHKPQLIVCHKTDGSFNGAVTWLCNPDSKASTHFVVAKDGRVAQLVDIQNTAWGNGTKVESTDSRYYKNSTVNIVKNNGGNANNYSISIEFESLKNESGELTDLQFKAGVELVKHIVSEVKRLYNYEINVNAETLVGHCNVTPKWKPNCPGKLFPFEQIIESIGNVNMKEKRKFIVNGKEITEECYIEKGVTYPPLRVMAEMLGFNVHYDAETEITFINQK